MRRPGPAFLPAGTALTSWLVAGPQLDRERRMALWAYRWKAYWFDRNWRRQETLYPVSPFEGEGGCNLVFVMGFWRSGTTLLHELLALGPQMAAPRTWQCMNPSSFLIAGSPLAHAVVSRPMDAVAISALTPQEDEFALLARGAPSVYRAWIDPRRWEEVLPALLQDTWLSLDDRKWFDDWRTFLGWCFPRNATTLIVKSPNHVFRMKALHKAWPKARYVWTLRDPVETWLSNRKMWSAMTAMYGLWQWRAGDLDRLLLRALEQYAASLRWAVDALAHDNVAHIDFDRLTTNTREVLRELTIGLKLGAWELWASNAQPRLEESARHLKEAYSTTEPLPEYAGEVIEDVRALHRRLLGPERVTRP